MLRNSANYRRRMPAYLLPLLLVLTSATPSILHAATAYLLNGDRLSGTIIRENSRELILETEHGFFRFPRAVLKQTRYDPKMKFRIYRTNGSSFIARIRNVDARGIRIISGNATRALLWNSVSNIRNLAEQ